MKRASGSFAPVSHSLLLGVLAIALAGCEPYVLKQTIPVSSNPIGAQVLADGQPVCVTPCQVELERNKDHILTLAKDGRQQDVVVKRVYQGERTLAKAISAGLQAGKGFQGVSGGINAGINSMNAQEQSGEAYLLSPSAVSVSLGPSIASLAAAPKPEAAPKTEGLPWQSGTPLPGLEILDSSDWDRINYVLETMQPGVRHTWTNQASKSSFAIMAQAPRQENGSWVRTFIIVLDSGASSRTVSATAARQSEGVWVIVGQPAPAEMPIPAGAGLSQAVPGDPEPSVQTAEPARPSADSLLKGLAVGAGAAAVSAIPAEKRTKEWSSTKVKEGVNPDGSYSRTETKKSFSIGIGPK